MREREWKIKKKNQEEHKLEDSVLMFTPAPTRFSTALATKQNLQEKYGVFCV